MPSSKIKIFCFTKDECELLEDWILYHGYIVGFENLILLDNQSTLPFVHSIYEKYKSRGITVYSVGGSGEKDKSAFMTQYMQKHKHEASWLIPLDTDEFLFSYAHLLEGKDPTDRTHILSTIEELPASQTWFTIASFPQSEVCGDNLFCKDHIVVRPARNLTTFAKDPAKSESCHWYSGCKKSFVRAEAFVSISMGNHLASVSHGSCGVARIGYFHFHSTGSRDLFERAKKHVAFNRFLNIHDDLASIVNRLPRISGPSHHRIWQYSYFITRMYIVNLFLENIHRYPTQEELTSLTKKFFHKSAIEMQVAVKQYDVCAEPFSEDKTHENDLVFFECPPDPDNIVSIDWLSKRLATLDEL